MDLTGSTWAPIRQGLARRTAMLKEPSSVAPPPATVTDQDDGLALLDRLLRRLKHRAHLNLLTQQAVIDAISDREACDNLATQFKLDFFELYTLLERVLVHLLNIFKIFIRHPDTNKDPWQNDYSSSPLRNITPKENVSSSTMIIGSAKGPTKHNFHLNVLQALDRPGPLHEILGRGTVRDDLGFAKDLRNRWKDADIVGVGARSKRQLGDVWDPRLPDLLTIEELQRILTNLFEALDRARSAAIEQSRKGTPSEANWHTVAHHNNRELYRQYVDAMDIDSLDPPYAVGFEAMELG